MLPREVRIYGAVEAITFAYTEPYSLSSAHIRSGRGYQSPQNRRALFKFINLAHLPACFTAAGESVRGRIKLILDSATRYFWNFEENQENKNRPFTPTEKRIRSAAAEAVELLKSGAWIPAEQVAEIAKKHRCGFDAICQEAKIAESDDGHFVCIPTDKTPAEPDRGSK